MVELSFEALDFDGNGDIEEYYKRVVKEDPFNPLFLRNYAQLLQVSVFDPVLFRKYLLFSLFRFSLHV